MSTTPESDLSTDAAVDESSATDFWAPVEQAPVEEVSDFLSAPAKVDPFAMVLLTRSLLKRSQRPTATKRIRSRPSSSKCALRQVSGTSCTPTQALKTR